MMTDNDKVLDADVKPLYIVTGSTDSMGSVITRKLAEQGKAVLLASRDIQKAENYATQLRKVTRNKDISCLQLDLNSFELVNDFVARLRALNRPIAALINNAGLLPRRSEISPNGFEHAVQVNYLSRNIPSPEAGVVPTMRALDSNETGYLFSGTDKKVKTSTMLRNREMFIRLCNDTMRILKEHIDK